MDIKEKAAELVETIKKDPALLKRFRENPVQVLEKLLGVDLPDDQINRLAELIKAKIDLDKAGALLGREFAILSVNDRLSADQNLPPWGKVLLCETILSCSTPSLHLHKLFQQGGMACDGRTSAPYAAIEGAQAADHVRCGGGGEL